MVEALSNALRDLDSLIKTVQSLDGAEPAYNVSSTPEALKENAPKAIRKPSKAAKLPIAQPGEDGDSNLDMFAKAKIAIGLVRQVEAVANSDKLYRCQVQVGEDQQRQIVAGLKKHIDQEELLGRRVVVILNLKAAKLAGETSECMILAAVQKGTQYDNGELVSPLSAPDGAQIGELVFLEGSEAKEDLYPKECKQWKKLLPFLAVQSSSATFKGKPMLCKSGSITADKSIPDGAGIS